MAEEIITSPEESISMDAPIVESPVDIQEEVVDVQPTPSKGLQNLQTLHSLLKENDVYSKITPERFDDFVNKYKDPAKLKTLHSLLIENDVYSKIMPADLNEAADKYGFGGLGKPSAVPSPSVDGGSATKGRGVEQPSTLQPRSSEASLDNIEQTMKVYADGQGMFPETLSAADVKELRKQVAGGELPNVSDEKVAKMLAGKSPKQVRIASINAIPDIKERKTEQARMYKDFAREKSLENQQLDQNITALTQGLEQIKAEGENLQQQLQNPNIDPQTAAMLSESLQQTQANYNQAANDYNNELNKYQQNARFIKTMGAGVESNLKGLIPSSMFMPRSPSDVMAASAFNSTAPALLKTLGAVVDIFPSMVYGEDAKDSNSPVADALFNIADKITIDIGKYNPQANVSLMDDVNAANASQLFGSLLGSVAMTFGGGAVAGATGSQIAGFSQVYGDVYKQGKDAGLTQAEAMYFALPTGLVAAYFGDKGVESLAGVFAKTSLKSAIKQGVKELAEKRTPQMMMEFGQKVLTNTLKGSVKEGLQEGSEFVTEFGSKKGASLKEGVNFQDDLTFKGFKKGLAESVIGGAAGGGLLGPFFGAGRNQAFADVVNKAARDPQAEADFIEQVNASVVANDITQEQQKQILEMLEKTKQAASTVPPVVESEPARAEATALVLEQQDLQEQIEQTNPAMAKPLNDRLDEVNNRLGEIAEGKNLPTEPTTEQAPQAEATTEGNVAIDGFTGEAVEFINETRNYLLSDIEYYKQIIEEDKPKTIRGKLARALIYEKNNNIGGYKKALSEAEADLNELDANPIEYFKRKKESTLSEETQQYFQNSIDYLEQNRITPQAQAAPQTLPEVTNEIANLREQEQAENEETYNKYDEAITPLLEQEKELTAQASLEENGVSLRGVKFSDIVVDDKYLEDILDDNKLSDEEKKQVREVFTRGVTYFKFDKEGEQKFQEKFANPEDITDVADIITGVSAAEESNFNNYNTTNYENVKDAIKYILNNPNDYSPNVVKALTEIKEKLENPSSSMSRLYAVDVMKELGITESTQKSEALAPIAEKSKDEKAPTDINTKKAEIENRIVITGTDGGFEVYNTSNIKNEKAGTIADVRRKYSDDKYEIEFGKGDDKKSIFSDINIGEKKSYHYFITDKKTKKRYYVVGISSRVTGTDPQRDGSLFATIEDDGNITDFTRTILELALIKEFENQTKKRRGIFKPLPQEFIDKVNNTYAELVAEEKQTPTSEQAPQAFPAQEGAESVEDKFQANSELEQIYRDLNAAVTKNIDKQTLDILKTNPTEAMVDKVMRELQKKGVIKIDCK